MQAVHAAGFSRLYAVYKNDLARLMCSHRARLVLDVTEQCCGVCLSTLTDRGSASCSLVLTIAGTVLDRGRNTWARPTSISRPLCGAQEFLAATAGARAIPCRTPPAPSSPDGTPWGRQQNQTRGGKGGKVGKVGNPPATLSAVRCLNFGGRYNCRLPATVDTGERWPMFRRPVFFLPILSRTWRGPHDHPQGGHQVSSHCHIIVIGQ